jgi:hypothetical protein
MFVSCHQNTEQNHSAKFAARAFEYVTELIKIVVRIKPIENVARFK